MSRVVQLAVGIAAVTVGAALALIITIVWRPCADVPMPLDPVTAGDCGTVTSSGNTGWIGLLLWPVALATAGFAVVRAVARGWGVASWAIAIVLGALVLLANPLPEYWLLNLSAKSWDEPPYTGSFTALTFVVAGAVLVSSREQRVRPVA